MENVNQLGSDHVNHLRPDFEKRAVLLHFNRVLGYVHNEHSRIGKLSFIPLQVFAGGNFPWPQPCIFVPPQGHPFRVWWKENLIKWVLLLRSEIITLDLSMMLDNAIRKLLNIISFHNG